MKPLFNPSLMCMDFLRLEEQMRILNRRAGMYHVDIMDGHFVPNITLSPDITAAFAGISELPLDIHLMVTDPGQYLPSFEKAVKPLRERGIPCYYSPHAEVMNGKAFRLIQQISAAGFQPGVVLNPETPLSTVMSYLHRLDILTVMSVDPGFAGQPFIPEVLDKIREAKALKEKDPEKYHYIIQVDGACNKRTFAALAEAGVESYVVGSSGLFGLDADLEKAFEQMVRDFEEAHG